MAGAMRRAGICAARTAEHALLAAADLDHAMGGCGCELVENAADALGHLELAVLRLLAMHGVDHLLHGGGEASEKLEEIGRILEREVVPVAHGRHPGREPLRRLAPLAQFL